MSTSRFDYVIVGAGTAGCVLADRLSQRGDRSVLVLEAGPSDSHWTVRVPAGLMKMNSGRLNARRYDWEYPGEPDPSMGNRALPWPAGKVLGGSSTINGMVWVRGNPHDFDLWARMGCTGWDYATVLESFKRAERFVGDGDDRYRGRSGPVVVSRNLFPHVLNDAFIDSAVDAGHVRNQDYNGASQTGVGYTQVNIRRGLRASTARAYLRPSRRRSNLVVHKGACVERVIVEDLRAVGVEYVSNGQRRRAMADREVILSAGAIASPKLLMLSGIGPEAHLREMGIAPVYSAPLVGQNLTDHLGASMTWRVNVPTLNNYFTPGRMTRAAYEWVVRHRGPIASVPSAAMLFGNYTSPDRCDWQVHVVPFGTTSGTKSDDGIAGVRMLDFPAMRAVLHTLHPRTRGQVRLRSPNPGDAALIEHELLADPEDIDNLRHQADVTRDIVRRNPLARYVVEEIEPGPRIKTNADWTEHLRGRAYRCRHPVSTCAMGPDDGDVVDPTLKVRGVSGLRVVDASIMPTIVSGNTHAATIMVGERGAELILADEE